MKKTIIEIPRANAELIKALIRAGVLKVGEDYALHVSGEPGKIYIVNTEE